MGIVFGRNCTTNSQRSHFVTSFGSLQLLLGCASLLLGTWRVLQELDLEYDACYC